MSENVNSMTGPQPDGPAVSIQSATAPDAVTGHLAWGVLIQPALVAVPGPLDWLLADSRPVLEVLLAEVGPGQRGIIERTRPSRVDVWALEGFPEQGVGLFRLPRPSTLAPTTRTPSAQAARQQTLTPDRPDAWTTLEAAGMVPPGFRDRSGDAMLRLIADWERSQQESLVRLVLSPVNTWCICCFFGCN